jgi:hypothetical protein
MRYLTIGLSLAALFIASVSPADAGEGLPGRRVGGGTRWTTPRLKPSNSVQNRLAALSFASRNHLPASLMFKAMYR